MILDWSDPHKTPRAYRELARCPDTGSLLLPLTHGYQALIDECDEEAVTVFRWNAQVTQKWVYARRSTEVGGKKTTITLHRFLMKPPAGMMVDHINQNTLDNRRSNLRLASPGQNTANSRRRPSASGYRGVSQDGATFRAIACQAGVTWRSSPFGTAEEAARAYDYIAARLFGEFAVLNFRREGGCDE